MIKPMFVPFICLVRNYSALIFGITFILSSGPALANDPVCSPCNGKYEDIALLIGADLPFVKAGFNGIIKDFNGFPKGLEVVKKNPVQSLKDLRETIISVGKECKKIRFLGILAHGQPGVISLSKYDPKNPEAMELLSVLNLKETLGGLDCTMTENAHILLASCLAGKACLGKHFITAIAETLLTKGGRITAYRKKLLILNSTSVRSHDFENENFKVELEINPKYSDLKDRYKKRSLKPVPWFSECQKRVIENLADLKIFASKAEKPLEKEDQETLDDALAKTEHALATYPTEPKTVEGQMQWILDFAMISKTRSKMPKAFFKMEMTKLK